MIQIILLFLATASAILATFNIMAVRIHFGWLSVAFYLLSLLLEAGGWK